MTTTTIEAIGIPDTKLASEVTELVRDTESQLLFNHSSRVYYFGALAGKHRGLKFGPDLLYVGAMFHDMGLTDQHSSPNERFEIEGANTARDFFRREGHRSTGYGHRLDRDCSAHDAGYSPAHASRNRLVNCRCRNGCARYRIV